MKKTALILLLVLPASLFSQNTQAQQIIGHRHKKAILFNANGLNLKKFNGGFGWKKWKSNSLAINMKIQILYDHDQKDRTNNLSGSEMSQTNFELTFGFEKHFHQTSQFSPYWGGSLGVGYERTVSKTIPNRALDYYRFIHVYQNEIERKRIAFSLHFVLGVEYFLRKNISLSGQYSFGGQYSLGKEKTVSNLIDGEQDISIIHIGIWSSSIILAIYL